MKFGHGIPVHCVYHVVPRNLNRVTKNSGFRKLFIRLFAAASILCSVILTEPFVGAATTSFTVTPSSASFGSVQVGTSKSLTVKITNSSSSQITLGLNTSQAEFYLASVPSNLTMAAKTSITFNVVFKPPQAKTYSAWLNWTSNGARASAIPLSGTGVTPQAAAASATTATSLTAIPSSAAFGSVPVGVSNTQTVKITNNSTSQITLGLNTSQAEFYLASVPTNLTMAAHASISFNVVFTPPQAKSYSAWLNWTSNGARASAIALTGTGVSAVASLSISTSALSFGDEPLNTKVTLPITLTSNGNLNVTISTVTASGTGFGVSGITNGTVLKPGQSATLEASFDPTTASTSTGKIAITSTASTSPTVSLSGTGVSAPKATVSLKWTAVSNAEGYYVYRASTSGGPYALLNASKVTAAQFTDSTVARGLTYYYVVTSVSSTGVQSSYSNQVDAPIPTSP